jgi:hypothetical protein
MRLRSTIQAETTPSSRGRPALDSFS